MLDPAETVCRQPLGDGLALCTGASECDVARVAAFASINLAQVPGRCGGPRTSRVDSSQPCIPPRGRGPGGADHTKGLAHLKGQQTHRPPPKQGGLFERRHIV